jgi:hypothetical protein
MSFNKGVNMIWKAKTSVYWESQDQGDLKAQIVFIPEKGYAAWRVQDNGKTVNKGRSDTILTAMNVSCAALLKYKEDKSKQMKMAKVHADDFKGHAEFVSTESNF